MNDTSDHAIEGSNDDKSAIPQGEQEDASRNLSLKLLLVDDEADGAEFAAILLGSHGLDVILVHSAADALRTLQHDKMIGTVLSDVRMPGITGLQLADEIRARYPSVKIILMSGYDAPAVLDDRNQPFQFITKPYRIDTLLSMLYR
jgi:DNA-binding NtrC family response regulator